MRSCQQRKKDGYLCHRYLNYSFIRFPSSHRQVAPVSKTKNFTCIRYKIPSAIIRSISTKISNVNFPKMLTPRTMHIHRGIGGEVYKVDTPRNKETERLWDEKITV